ncbi:MAG: metallophosphoesterase [Thermoplasmatales archaeon]|nr:MAG: metallophosphoesterase [Thermoplasmatales archaeon]
MTEIDNITNRVFNDPDFVACLNEKEIEICLDKVKHFLEREKTFIELNGKVVFVGDTHGDFITTKAIFKKFFNYDYLVFLGDYIDREPVKWGAIYNIIFLLIMKCCYPKKIILLKGNHECNYAIPCYPYEFEREIIQRFDSSDLHQRFIEVFSLMPLMVLSNSVFAAHGGFLKGYDLESLRKIDKNDLRAITSVVWSDPVVSLVFRGIGDRFTEEDLICFLNEINAKVFIKGHDYNTLGFSIYGDRCLTIFSSSQYKDMGNGGVLVAIKDKDVSCVSDLNIKDYSIGKWVDYKIFQR